MACLQVGRLRAHKVRELKSDCLVVPAAGRGLKFEAQLIELDRQELDRHIAVEGFSVGPALHPIAVGELLVYAEERIQLVVIYVAVLKGAGIYIIVYAVENLVPLLLMLLHAYRLFLGEGIAGGLNRFLSIDVRGYKCRKPSGHFFTLPAELAEGFDSTPVRPAYLAAEVPASETAVAAAVSLPHFIYDEAVAKRQRDIFLDDMKECSLIDPELWQKRSRLEKFVQSTARIFTPIL